MNNNSFSYYVQNFIITYLPITRNFSNNTITTYNYALQDFVKFLKKQNIEVDSILIEEITFDLIEKYIQYLKNKNNCAKTINIKLTVIKTLFDYIEIKTVGIIHTASLIKNIKPLKKQIKIPDYYTEEELHALLEIINKFHDFKSLAIVTLLYDAGLRVSELCNLKIENIILRNNTFYIQIINSKNKKNRIVPINNETKKFLEKYMEDYAFKNNDFLFYNKYKNKYTRKGISSILKKYCRIVQLNNLEKSFFKNGIHPHGLRHSKAVHLLESGVDMVTIRDFLGHSSITTTEIYARLTDETKEKLLLRNSKKKPLKNIKYSKKKKQSLLEWLKKQNFSN